MRSILPVSEESDVGGVSGRSPDLDEFKREFRALRAAQHSARKTAWEPRGARLSELEREIGHLIDAIARGLLTPAVKARLEAAESEQTALLSDRGGKSDGVADLLLRLSDTYRELVESLEHIPERHIPRARASLSGMTGGAIRLNPDGAGRFLTLSFPWMAAGCSKWQPARK